jgi:hypothetical protein
MPSVRIDLPQGTLDLLILRTLALGSQHGWAIAERVQQLSSDGDGSKPIGERRTAIAVPNTTS